nr:MAG TPA: hypothetical protein [Caudoviricetes sp.]
MEDRHIGCGIQCRTSQVTKCSIPGNLADSLKATSGLTDFAE